MLYRALTDPTPPADGDIDTAAMAETVSAVERGERRLRILARLTDIAMNLAEALGELAQARIEQAKKADGPPAPGETAAAAAFERMSQTVRRTVALEAKLAEGVKVRREGLIAERASRHADLDTAHESAKTKAILDGFHDAYAGSSSETEYQEQIERLMEDTEEYLGDADEMRGYLDRPVGETVARLCAAVGLDPGACALDGETWRVRRGPTEFEMTCEKLRNSGAIVPPSVGAGEGQDAKRPGCGSLTDPPPPGVSSTRPPPDGFAACPAP